ncbi:agamous-like MADS-box protein AGL61 [Rhodamnia argentea]|uniref:Agamous-like MADS-box protein AGL61 n=1 Tax=Rhodamnia argentea TaxID=178133 RepID=A0A8B8MUG2_9MYRT|nr:agamous-like MADS-box protein AGL61 [Rhodamnia argentea]
MARRQARGGRRAEMKQIANENSRQIAFSKRRSSIYKKASELVTLCGAEVGLVGASPTGKPFSFAHPSIDAVANRFLDRNPPPADRPRALVEYYHRVQSDELNRQHEELSNQIQAEKEHGKVLAQLTGGKSDVGWWEAPIEELNREELLQMKGRMEDLRRRLLKAIDQQARGDASASLQGQNLEK